MKIIFSIIMGIPFFAFAQCPSPSPAGMDCVGATANKQITAFSVCKSVTNNHATGKAIMVPINTSAEWSAFYGNAPAGVTVAACPAACAGATVGGYCWYLSGFADSCDTTCAAHGGYNSATLTYAGSAGSAANCQAVMTVLLGDSSITSQGGSYGVGCTNLGAAGLNEWYSSPPTTSSATAVVERACACNN